MRFAKAGIDYFGRMTREHALLLTCACAAILTFGWHQSGLDWPALNLARNSSNQNEAEVDAALLKAANEALAGREGTIIVMDAQTGRVRALVNSQLASQETLMPGSTMKPFTALTALRAGLIDPDSRTVCPGRFTGRSFSLPCVHPDHLPPFKPAQAIAYSCNYYFATLGQRLGRDQLITTLRSFGFGQPAADSADAAGMLRPCETGNARLREADHAAQSDCGAREAIGESDHIRVTPVQLLTAYTALVNGGRLLQPRKAGAGTFEPVERGRVEISEQHRGVIMEGMRGAIRYGTAKSAHLDSSSLYIVGKTGTAAPPKGFRPNGWFVGFASHARANAATEPAANEIELAVLVLVSRSHGAEAAALAGPIFEAFTNESTVREIARRPGKESDINSSKSPDTSSSVEVHLVTQDVTERLSLEDYVLGVMRAEGAMESEPEALKALAVAIRTYAVKNRGRHAKDGYDFCSTTHCQRFVGSSVTGQRVIAGARASDAITQAVHATEGLVLRDDHNQLVDSYFGASCGGETANIATLWGQNPPAYLRGVRDEYCSSGPHAKWTDSISRSDLLRALQSDVRTNVGAHLDQISVSERDETGRAEFVVLEGEHRKIVRGWDFKIIVGRVLGWNYLKSSRFEVTRAGANFVFHGSGFGHGLGLCQEGAHVMATRGASYQRILEKYFPGTSVGLTNRVAATMHDESLIRSNAADGENYPERAENIFRVPRRPLRLTTLSHHALAKKTITISSEHFRVTYPSGVARSDADQVLNTLESARADFQRRVAAASISAGIPTLEIRINDSTGDFTSRTGQPWWAAAATKGNRIELQPVAILKRRGVLTATLRHELAHVFIDAISQDRAPRWLEEGFAIYLAGEGRMYENYLRRGLLATDELEKRMEHPRTQADMRALYAQAYITVAELIRYHGEASVWKKVAGS